MGYTNETNNGRGKSVIPSLLFLCRIMEKITHIKQLKEGDIIRIDLPESTITERVLRIHNNEITTQNHRVFFNPITLFHLPVSEFDDDIPMIPRITLYKLARRKIR